MVGNRGAGGECYRFRMANRVEAIKRAKDGLDVFPDLLRYAREGFDAIPPDDYERLKWYGLFHRRATPGYFMLRPRIPNGVLTSEQAAAIGGIANRFGIPDCPERVHWEDEFAVEVGAPGAYDYGPERCSWMIHHLTDWMGDDGFVERSYCEIRRHNPVGDTLRLEAEVTEKVPAEDGAGGTVRIEQRARNQDGELSVRATASVRLPG